MDRVDEMSGNVNMIIGPASFSSRQLPIRQLSKPRGNTVHLWYLDFNHLSNPLNSGPDVDVAELSAFQRRATRRFYLRLILGAYLGIPGKDVIISRRLKGRPELDSAQSRGSLDFSVARSAGCYLIGVSSGATIGVDLEIASRRAGNPLAVARRYFSEDETAALAALSEADLHRAFMHTWSCKEAVVKASGLGIANQLCRFSVDVNPASPPAILAMPDDDPSAWKLAIASPASGAIAAIAVRQPSIKLEGFTLS